MQRRVVITGMGIVCAAGNNSESSWNNLQSEQPFLRPSSRYPGLGQIPVGEVQNLDLSAIIDPKSLRRAPLFVRYAMAAAYEAYHHAHANDASSQPERIGASIGTSHGSTLCYLDENPDLPVAVRQGTIPRALAFFPTAELHNLAAGLVSVKLQIKGPLLTPCSGMVTGLQSLLDGYQAIRSEEADMMLCGASDTPLAPLGVAAYEMAGRMSEDDYSPYGIDGMGFHLGEGACALMLEDRDHAVERNAPIFGEIVSYAFGNCSLNYRTAEDWFLTRRNVLRRALERVGLDYKDLTSVHLDTWALEPSDEADILLLRDMRNEGFQGSSATIKTRIGLTLGASSIMEVWAAINHFKTGQAFSNPFISTVIASDESGSVCVLILKSNESD
jgi:3-oxoacyl-[acyl-carrier-protein] synthase II